jgi:DNA polymerase III subunit delta'
MKFGDIIGHKEVIARLKGMVENKRIPHAILMNGEEGVGNLACAFAFAQYIFCESKQDGDSCGTCRHCTRMAKLEHPDIHLVFPFALSKDVRICDTVVVDFRKAFLQQPYLTLADWFNELGAENKQPVIPAEESDQIIKKLSYTSYEGRYKIMVIWMPEKMNITSANKLLKILEEPPDDTLFFLVTSHLDQLLTTILSRTQLVQFGKIPDEDIMTALQKKFGLNSEKARQVTALADGNYREALGFLSEDGGNLEFLQHFQNFMRACLKFDIFKVSEWVDSNASLGREKQKYFLQYALQMIRECLMFNYGASTLVKLGGEEMDFIKKFSPFIHQGNYEKIAEELNNAYYHVERNAHAKILFMDICLRMNELINVKKPVTG